jgi:hypothetical protein
MDAILCSGLTDADGEKSSGGKIELPKGELLAEVESENIRKIIFSVLPSLYKSTMPMF